MERIAEKRRGTEKVLMGLEDIARTAAAAIMIAVISVVIIFCGACECSYGQADWYRFQNSEENNGVTSIAMPPSYDEAALKWAKQLVPGYTTSFTPPLIIDGYLYTASKDRVYKFNKDTGDKLAESDEMKIDVNYAMHPMTYCEEKGLLFVPLKDGRVQCVVAKTLKLKWISKVYSSCQSLSPIAYKDGKVYTGIWSKENSDGVYFCLDADTGKTLWEFRPSEQVKETTASALRTFPKYTGADKPDNFYTYTALITVHPKSGYLFATDKWDRYWLYDQSSGSAKKYMPSGINEGAAIPCTIDGHAATLSVYSADTAVVRVQFNYYEGKFSWQKEAGEVSPLEIKGLTVPVVGAALDTDVQTDSPVTIEKIEWMSGDIPHGFYWAGPYVTESHVVFGSDDGQNNTFNEAGSSSYTDTAILYSVDRETGAVTDKIEGLRGDVRSTVVYHEEYIYFTTKGGRLYKVKLNSDGTFDKSTLSYFSFDGLMTASPVIYGGRIYVGVSGTGGQFNADGGHMFAVLRDDAKLSGSYSSKTPGVYSGSLIYTTKIAGYPQASPVLSTGTGGSGNVRLYFTFNAFPGGIYFLEDSPLSTGSSHKEAKLLFRPETEMQQYSLSPIAADSDGTIYIKNDSGYLMAVAVNKAYLPSADPDKGISGISVKYRDDELEWNQPFMSGTLNYTLRAPNGASAVDVRLDVPGGMTAKINGEPYNGGNFQVPVSENASAIPVTVSKNEGGKLYTRTYTLNLASVNNNANLAGIALTDSNVAPKIVDSGSYHASDLAYGYDPVFDAGTTRYVSRTYTGNKRFVNVWVETEDPEATVKCWPVDSVGNKAVDTEDDGSIQNKDQTGRIRFPIYWIKGKISAEVKIVVTPPSGIEEAKKEYSIELVRSEDFLDVGNEPLVLSEATADLYLSGGRRTISIKAFYGDKDVTKDCVWYSSRPDIASVDAEGNVAAQNNAGDAIIWARYGAQDTEDRPVVITVRKEACIAPKASLDPGEYDTAREVALSTETQGAAIYYNIAEGNTAVEAPDSKSTRYTGPIKVGRAGVRTNYKIRAVAIRDQMYVSSVSDLSYVIDLREKVQSISLTGVSEPAAGKPLSADVTASGGAALKSAAWYKVSGGTETPVTGAAESGASYRLRAVLAPDDGEHRVLTADTVVLAGGKSMSTTLSDDGTLIAEADFTVGGDVKYINKVILTGVTAPAGGSAFISDVLSATQGAAVSGAEWKCADRSAAPEKAEYYTDYLLSVAMKPETGYKFADNVAAQVNVGGVLMDAEAVHEEGGNLIITVTCRTAAAKLTGFTVRPESIDFDNGVTVGDIRKRLKESVVVTAVTEDGGTEVIPSDDVYWDEDVIIRAYDPEAVNSANFTAVCDVTLPEKIDANGISTSVMVRINVKEGKVEAPVITPGAGVYTAEQTITASCPAKGAAIYFTRSDEEDTFTYEEPFTLSGSLGKKVTYELKMFAMKNGVKSETVIYKVTIDRTAEGAKASEHSLDKITPDEEAAAGAGVSSKLKALNVSTVKTGGNPSKKNMIFTFSKVAGAVNYRVEYRKAGASDWYYVWSKGKTSVKIAGLQKGAAYEVKIAPYAVEDGLWKRGQWSGSILTYLQTVKPTYKAKKKAVTVKVKKVGGATGYKVKYSLKKNMKGARTKTFKGAGKTTMKIGGLKSKKTYYIQVAPYKTISGKSYIGVFTAAKKIKVR